MMCATCAMRAQHGHGLRSVSVHHTCDGVDCFRPLELTRYVDLDGGARRWSGVRCDGSAIEVVEEAPLATPTRAQ